MAAHVITSTSSIPSTLKGRRSSIWIEPFGSWNKEGQRGELHGANYQSRGVLIGGNYSLERLTLGCGSGYTNTHFNWHDEFGKGGVNQLFGALFGSYHTSCFRASYVSMGGGNFYKTDRRILANTPGHPGAFLDRIAKSHSFGFQWSQQLGLSFDLASYSFPFKLFLECDHCYLHQKPFEEDGANSLNLKVHTKVSNALRSELGICYSRTFYSQENRISPFAQIGWVNKTILSKCNYRGTFAFQEGAFAVNTTNHSLNQWSPEIGIECSNRNGLSFLLSNRYELSGKVKNYFLNCNVRYAF